MAFIYDLDNEGGATLLQDSDGGGPALKVNSNAAGQPAIAVLSTASGNPIQVDAFDFASRFRTNTAAVPAVAVSRTVAGSQSIAALRVEGSSVASGALIAFGGGFISVTSILGIAATGAAIGFSKVLPVADATGNVYGIPLTSLASLPGAAAF